MKVTCCTILLLALNLPLSSKSIKGQVVDAETHEPVAFATVFLSGTMIGTTTDTDGQFSFQVPSAGKYDLIVRYVGYREHAQQINTSIGNPFLEIALEQEVIELKDVYVNADTTGWKNNYQTFKGLFLGTTKNASKVAIENPKDIFLFYDPVELGLFAHSKKEIIITNEALGYRLNYSIKDFQMLYESRKFWSVGIPRFEELIAKNNRQQKRWDKERKRAYDGSFTHFIQSLKDNTLNEEGFIVHELHKVKNPNRPPQELINEKLSNLRNEFKKSGKYGQTIVANDPLSDSLRYWGRMARMEEFTDSLGREHTSNKLLLDSNGDLSYTGYLKVVFTKEREEDGFGFMRSGGAVDNKQTSLVYVEGPLTLHSNGYYDVSRVLFIGYWAWSSKLAEMLPLEYVPESE